MEKKFKAVLIDDEQHCIDNLLNHITDIGNIEVVKCFNNPKEAISFLSDNKVDFVITDIEMPGVSGIEFLEQFGNKMKFVVSSAFPQYAVEGFNHNIVDYLLKPVTFARFAKCVDKIKESFIEKHTVETGSNTNEFMFVKTEAKGVRQKIDYNKITLIEGKTNYIGIRTTENKSGTLVLMNLKDIIEQLPTGKFMRVHSSFIVPVNNITKIEGNCLLLHHVDEKIPIGISYKQMVQDRLKIY